jgi:hypothetical protein
MIIIARLYIRERTLHVMQVQRDALCIHQAKQTKAKQLLLTTFKSTQPQPSQVSPRHATGAMFGGLVDGARLGDWAALVKEKGQALVEESKALADKLSLDRLQEEEVAAAAGVVGSAAAAAAVSAWMMGSAVCGCIVR